MSLPSDARLRQNERTASRLVDGKAVVIVIDARRLHTLNGVGSRVWQLADGRSVDAITRAIVEEFEVDRPTAERDIDAFVRELRDLGALDVLPPEAP